MKKHIFLMILFSFISTIQLTHCFRFYNATGHKIVINKTAHYRANSKVDDLDVGDYSQSFPPYDEHVVAAAGTTHQDKIKFKISIPDLKIDKQELNLDQYSYESLSNDNDIIILILDPLNGIRYKLIRTSINYLLALHVNQTLQDFKKEIKKEFEEDEKRGIKNVISGSHCIIQ